MPRNFNDDISVLSDKSKGFFGRSRSSSRSRSRARSSATLGAANTSSQSVTSAPRSRSSRRASSRGLGFGNNNRRGSSTSQSVTSAPATRNRSLIMGKRNPFSRNFRKGGPDDVSVSDSLCSGVLRDMIGDDNSMTSRGGGGSIGNSAKSSQSALTPHVLPGGVADFNKELQLQRVHSSASSSLSHAGFDPKDSLTSGGGEEHSHRSMEAMSIADDAIRREARKEKVKEKLNKYKMDQKHLKKSCVALEQQLAQTTEKLKEVDSKAAFRIDTLESELRETRSGMEQVAKQSTKEVTGQSECIKTLGKKLIRQAHVIKRQKNAVDQYKVQLQALQEEMAMQDERDHDKDEDYQRLREDYECLKEQKIQMQNLLQENIEEMMDLKAETERDAKSIMELEFNLQQKDATLDRVAGESSEKSQRICLLESELEEKEFETQGVNEKLKESEASVEETKKELERVNGETNELRCNYEKAKGEAEELRCNFAAQKKDSTAAYGEGEGSDGEVNSAASAVFSRPVRKSMADRRQSSSLFGGSRGLEDDIDEESFEAALQAKDATIQTLDETVQEHEGTIKSLRSDMVKMSIAYKQDSYLRRKEIAQLKQRNAEYALKLRALEKAFKNVNATQNMSLTTSGNFHGHTTHGASNTRGSLGGGSLHSAASLTSKEDKVAAVKARLGGGLRGMAPYEFPSAAQLQKDSEIVMQSNFFDGEDRLSEDGRKGELPEEC